MYCISKKFDITQYHVCTIYKVAATKVRKLNARPRQPRPERGGRGSGSGDAFRSPMCQK